MSLGQWLPRRSDWGIFWLVNDLSGKSLVRADWADLGLSGTYQVRDLWQRKDLPAAKDHVELFVPFHGTALLRLTKGK